MIIELIGEILFCLFVLAWAWLAFYGPYSERARREYINRQIALCDAIAEADESKRKKLKL